MARSDYRPVLAVLPVVLLIMAASTFSFDPLRAGTPGVFAAMVVANVAAGIWAGLWAHREGLISDWITPRWGDITAALVLGVVTFAGAWAFLRFVAPSGTPREVWLARVYLQVGGPDVLRSRLTSAFVGIVLAAAAEEMVWRGYVTARLESTFGSRRAWMVSAVLYALAHAPTAWLLRDTVVGPNQVLGPNPVVVLGALGLGILYGGVVRVTGRLIPLILAHALFDWAAIVMFRFWGPSV